MATEERPKGRMAERLAKRREAYQRRGRVYRAGFVAVGALVTLAGIGMLLLPGPALVVIPIGLAMLAMQFDWAEQALEKALDQAEAAQHKAVNASPVQKALGIAATVVALAAFVVAAVLWDIPLLPV